MKKYQRCKGCGKEWRRYDPKSLPFALAYLLAMLPVWWWHVRFSCPRKVTP